MSRAFPALWVTAGMLLGSPLLADPECPPQELVYKCVAFLESKAGMTVKASTETASEIEQSGREAEQRAANDAVPAESPGTASAFRDTLSTFFATLGVGTLSEEKGDLTLNFNSDLFNLSSAEHLSPQIVIHQPKVSEALLDSALDADRALIKEKLSSELGDLDDVELSLTWSRHNDHFGPTASAFFDEVFRQVSAAAANAAATKAAPTQDWRAFLAAVTAKLKEPTDLYDLKVSDLSKMFPEEAQRLPAVLVKEIERIERLRSGLANALTKVRFDALADLGRNQPQVLGTATYRRRGPAVGPEEWNAKVTYEMGFANLNDYRKECPEVAQSKGFDIGCYGRYVDFHQGDLDKSSRLAFSLEHSEASALDFTLPSQHFAYHLDRTHKTIGSMTFGRFLNPRQDLRHTTRLDIEARYEDVTGDPTKKSRFVATATFTQTFRSSDNGSGPMASLSFVYASKPAFLPDVNKKLSARFGLKYKLDKAAK